MLKSPASCLKKANLDHVKREVTRLKNLTTLVLALTCIIGLTGCSAESIAISGNKIIFEAEILEIEENYYLVEPIEGSHELKNASRIKIPMKNMDSSLEPQIGDIIEISYNGEIQKSDPAEISEVYSIKVSKEADMPR